MAPPLDEPSPQPLSSQDVVALIGVLSVLEASSLGGRLDDNLAHELKSRLQRDGQIAKASLGQDGLRAALNGLNLRLRRALGDEELP